MRLNAFLKSLEAAGCVRVSGIPTAAGQFYPSVTKARRPYGATVVYYQMPDADKAFERTFDWKEDYRGERERT